MVFKIKYRYYKYKIIFFKLINIPIMFQKFINLILGKYLFNFVVIYLNNILVFSKNYKKYIKYIKIILEKL